MSTGYRVIHSPQLRQLTSMRLGGAAIAHVFVESLRGFESLPHVLSSFGGEPRVLGEGSNIIASDGALPIVLISADPITTFTVVDSSEEDILVDVPAAMRMPALLRVLAEHGFSGLEALAGIPGNIGGAVAMNAGSYGREIGEVVEEVRIFCAERGYVSFSVSECSWAYRHFGLPGTSDWFVVESVRLRLQRSAPQVVKERMKATYFKKKQTQPITSWSAGCVFANPPGESAGRLLDRAGLKGFRLGGMALSPIHANFLINEKNGSFDAAMELIDMAQARVKELFNIELQLEARIWR